MLDKGIPSAPPSYEVVPVQAQSLTQGRIIGVAGDQDQGKAVGLQDPFNWSREVHSPNGVLERLNLELNLQGFFNCNWNTRPLSWIDRTVPAPLQAIGIDQKEWNKRVWQLTIVFNLPQASLGSQPFFFILRIIHQMERRFDEMAVRFQ